MSRAPSKCCGLPGGASRASPNLALSELRQQWRSLSTNPEASPHLSPRAADWRARRIPLAGGRARAGSARSASASFATLAQQFNETGAIRRACPSRTEIGNPAGSGVAGPNL